MFTGSMWVLPRQQRQFPPWSRDTAVYHVVSEKKYKGKYSYGRIVIMYGILVIFNRSSSPQQNYQLRQHRLDGMDK